MRNNSITLYKDCNLTDNHLIDEDRVILGIVSGVHGLKGHLKIKSYTQKPLDILSYPSLNIGEIESINLSLITQNKNYLVCSVASIYSRSEAEIILNQNVWIHKEILKTNELNEFYHKDLIGINVVDKKNNLVGKIKAIHNFGAGDIIELNSNFSHMVRFDSKNIVKIDLLKKSIILSFEMSDYVK